MTGRPCIFGEVLFDYFPDGRRVLGGAPFNVAWHLQAFGEAPYFVSRVGTDDAGLSVRTAMEVWGMDRAGLQLDGKLSTGRVQVSIADGEPSYEIVCPAAWDAIEPDSAAPALKLLYHGSLALRRPASRRAWRQLRDRNPPLVFVDVNLRSPWWDHDRVLAGLWGAQWAKLNRDELDRLLPGHAPARSRARDLLRACGLHGLVLTDGARGAELLTSSGQWYETRPRTNVAVVDTVGAGDALAAVTILGLLHGWPPQDILDRAQEFASAIVGQRGATVRDPAFYQPFKDRFTTDV